MNAADARALLNEPKSCSRQNKSTPRPAKGTRVESRLRGQKPLVLGVMVARWCFGPTDAATRFPMDFDIVQASRYGEATVGTHLTWRVTPRDNVKGGMCCSSTTFSTKASRWPPLWNCSRVRAQRASNAQFLREGLRRGKNAQKPLQAKYVGLTVPNRFIFGYGMDVSGAWRNLPAIWAKREGLMEKH